MSRISIELEEMEIINPTLLGGIYERISYSRCVFKADVVFYEAEVFSTVSFIECTFEGTAKLHFRSGKFHKLVSMSFKNLPRLYIESGEYHLLYVGYWGNRTYIKEIHIDDLRNCQGQIYIFKSDVTKIYLHGDNLATTVKLGNLRVNSLIVNNVTAHVPIKLVDVSALNIDGKDSECNFHFSNFGESEFYDVDFDSFTDFNMQNSFVGNSAFFSCLIDKSIKAESGQYLSDELKSQQTHISTLEKHLRGHIEYNRTGDDIDAMGAKLEKLKKEYPEFVMRDQEKRNRYRRENYKQFKISFQKIGDSVNERRFHALEMNEYLSQPMHWTDQLILRLSSWSSNFGQSLIRPFVFHIFIIHLLLFLAYFVTSEDYYFTKLRDHSWSAAWMGFKDFLFLMSPFRDLILINPGILDLLLRINAGFFLYNFLRASRKFYQ